MTGVPHRGDFPEDTTDVVIPFNTTDALGAAVTATVVDADVQIYKGSSLTKKTTANGVVVDVDVDAVVGAHWVTIDTSNDTGDAGFWVAGEHYSVMLNTITVDSQTWSGFIGTFTIELPQAANVEQWLGTAVATPTTAGVPEVDVTFWAGNAATASAGNPDVNVESIDDIDAPATWKTSINAEADTALSDFFTSSAQLVDDVWDEVLTGATHNVANSAGRRLRQIQESGGYTSGFIYIDTVNGSGTAVDFEDGVDSNPVSTIALANTLSASLGITNFHVAAGSSITFAAAQSGQSFHGTNWTLALGGQDISGSYFSGATVSGVASGTGSTQIFENCIMNACSHIKGTHLNGCSIAGTQTVVEAGDFFLDRCHSGIAGTSTWIWEFGDAIGNTNLNVRNYSGGIQLESMGDTGTDTASIEGQGQIIEGTCAGGAVTVRGMFTISGITNITLTDDARIDVAQINAEVDTALTDIGLDHLIAVADGDDPVDGSIIAHLASSTEDWSTFVPSTDSLQAIRDRGDAAWITATGFSTHTAAAVADAVWDEAQADHTAAGSFGETATEIASILVDTAEIGAAGAGLTDLGGMSTAMKAEVNVEVLDVHNTDTITLPGQTAPPLAPTLREAVGWLFKVLRNRKDQTSTLWQLYADDETTVDAKATVSNDGTTATKQEIVSGP